MRNNLHPCTIGRECDENSTVQNVFLIDLKKNENRRLCLNREKIYNYLALNYSRLGSSNHNPTVLPNLYNHLLNYMQKGGTKGT
jgi:hypothetical protein